MKRFAILLVCLSFLPLFAHTYTPGSRDKEVMERIDERLDYVAEKGGKEHLVGIFARVEDIAEEVENTQTLYLLEYTMQVIAAHLKKNFEVVLTRDSLIDDTIEVDVDKKETKEDTQESDDDEDAITPSSVSGDPSTPYTLEEFYTAYKGYVTSETPISELCTDYYDEIDAVAKAHDFPTALIVATRYREHTCKFSNPTNGWGNFQITSHYYPAGDITWAKFENQIINFIVFSRAKWDYYDDVQTYGEAPIALSYDMMDLTSLRKHAIFYNGIRGELDTNTYANQNFARVADGRDGIVAMTIRALGWQLHEDRTEKLQTIVLEEKEEEIEEEVIEDEETSEEEVGEEESNEDCEEPFTENLGPDANHPEVLVMQEFLADQGFYSGDPSAVYDGKTTEAVNAFQAYYKEEILDPGGYLAPTGYWYPATRRKANALVCA